MYGLDSCKLLDSYNIQLLKRQTDESDEGITLERSHNYIGLRLCLACELIANNGRSIRKVYCFLTLAVGL